MDITLSKLVADKDISTRLYMQLCDLKNVIQITEEQKGILFQRLVEVMKKLETVKYHRDNLLKRVAEQMEARRGTDHENNCYEIDFTTGVEKEFEAFLIQGKSSLDILVQVLQPLFGIKLHSYGDGGTRVIKALRNNLPREEVERAQGVIQLIDDDREWIEKWFKSERDTVTHYRTIVSSGFVAAPRSIESGTKHLVPTPRDGTPFHQAVNVLYYNLLTFCQDFIPLAVSVKFHRGIVLRVNSRR